MKQLRAFLMVTVIAGGSWSQAGFHCIEDSSQLEVRLNHDHDLLPFEESEGSLELTTPDGVKKLMNLVVHKRATRATEWYSYKVPDQDFLLSIEEKFKMVTQPGCKPGGRITCDYDWVHIYTGYLSLGGNLHELTCAVL